MDSRCCALSLYPHSTFRVTLFHCNGYRFSLVAVGLFFFLLCIEVSVLSVPSRLPLFVRIRPWSVTSAETMPPWELGIRNAHWVQNGLPSVRSFTAAPAFELRQASKNDPREEHGRTLKMHRLLWHASLYDRNEVLMLRQWLTGLSLSGCWKKREVERQKAFIEIKNKR